MAAQRGPSLTTKQFVEQLFLLPPPPPPVEEGGGDGQVVDDNKNKGTLCCFIKNETLVFISILLRYIHRVTVVF